MEYSLGPLLRLAAKRAADAFAAALVPLDIEGRHFGVLLNLNRGGPANQRRLAGATGSDKSTMTRTIDELAARGLVVRRATEADRRVNVVELTEAGRARFAEAERVAARVNDELLAHLTPEERDGLRDHLRRFVEA
ncbi:MarR family transcriptional regulator [Dactylosporangium sp. NPDC049140]|jgi:DNA-binding MarR family transcriptional regulator|uniref:MarR family winged helix-turn-helix transcriptional regulator n=1 Tax=Dactylosporangium sp. NPDC049140 TaxID=3155647 RepID=UPI003403E656